MSLPGHQNGQTTHRLILTLSIAYLLHTLLLAAILHNWVLQPEPEASTVRFTLLANRVADSAASQQSHDSSASSKSPAETSPKAAPAEPDVPLATREAEPTESARLSRTQPQSVNSEKSESGSPVEETVPKTKELRARIPEKVVEQDPYITLLWQYISDELDSRPVRSIHELNQMRTVRLELHLMENGALRQVDTIESSGKPTLDQAARQSALAASPYPRPPESAREKGFRFQVELRFTPRSSD